MIDYTITDEMLISLVSYAYDCGTDAERQGKTELPMRYSKAEVLHKLRLSVAKHDREVKSFKKKLNEYEPYI